MADKYLLFDLEDDKSKKLGEVISSPTCKKIVNLLAEKELGESEISRELKMPLNTVEYNLKKLVESGLIEESKSFWSVKGRKMPSYKVSNKMIVISPKKSSSVYSKLKSIVPVVIIAGILTFLVSFYYKSNNFVNQKISDNLPTASGAESLVNRAGEAVSSAGTGNPWVWFAVGAGIVILAFVLWNFKKL